MTDLCTLLTSYPERLRIAVKPARRACREFEVIVRPTGIPHLWIERGGQARARDLLAPVRDRFREGFGLPDLIEAEAVLDAT